MLLSKTDIDVREFNEPISGGNAPYNDVEEVVIVLLEKDKKQVKQNNATPSLPPKTTLTVR